MRVFKTTYTSKDGRAVEADKWYVEFADHREKVRRLAGFNFGRRGKTNYVEIIPPGFIHRLHVEDPAHYDEQGRYLWWGD